MKKTKFILFFTFLLIINLVNASFSENFGDYSKIECWQKDMSRDDPNSQEESKFQVLSQGSYFNGGFFLYAAMGQIDTWVHEDSIGSQASGIPANFDNQSWIYFSANFSYIENTC